MEHIEDSRVMSVGEWMITLLVLGLPIINIIMYIVWALDTTGNPNRRNFCRASLLWFAIMMAVSILIVVVMAMLGMIFGAASQQG
jgi:hypothetical protein